MLDVCGSRQEACTLRQQRRCHRRGGCKTPKPLQPQDSGVSAELVCWLGVAAALLISTQLGERLTRTRVDAETVFSLLPLFAMVGAVRQTGAFGRQALRAV